MEEVAAARNVDISGHFQVPGDAFELASDAPLVTAFQAAHTAVTGKPLLANDPHISATIPDVWYTVELSTPDIETDTPYNTRMHAGLPPTPIASPGAASLRAALEPKPSPYLYYVLCPKEGDGVHRFAETYDEHLANVRECLG